MGIKASVFLTYKLNIFRSEKPKMDYLDRYEMVI